jgi:uncharacterized protein
MRKQIIIHLRPEQAAKENVIRETIATHESIDASRVSGFHIIKRSVDARSKSILMRISVMAFIDEPFVERDVPKLQLRQVDEQSRTVIIIGAGPAGLFAALRLLESGIRPVILERGKDVRSRRRDLAAINREGVLNPDSNYCFGEGGAGTYSDGKLYTRSNKRGDINRILNIFVQFGAAQNILYDAHPHIGTNKLPDIITAIRTEIISRGGMILFEKNVTDLLIRNNQIDAVVTRDGDSYKGDAVILATGHSARDIYLMLHAKQIAIEYKPFAIGVRVEHPQSLIDEIQYHAHKRSEFLPPASYSLVRQVFGKGVFSFCMCPGGIIAPASTGPEELVVNGWSPSKRNNPFANSGIVTAIDANDLQPFKKDGALSGLRLQQSIERNAFEAGGGKYVAPGQRLADFTSGKISADLPACSYLPGTISSNVASVFPKTIASALQQAFCEFNRLMPGYLTNEAMIVATESRTSSPVRIPRDKDGLNHPQVTNLFPCGEGAGYAGGIVSAAMDGERVATLIAAKITAGIR